jgi:phosphate transport system substrate-binding protein
MQRFLTSLAAALLCAAYMHAAHAAHPAPAALIDPSQPYVLPDGSIAIVGNDGLEDVMRALNALFTKAHPEVRFTWRMAGADRRRHRVRATDAGYVAR